MRGTVSNQPIAESLVATRSTLRQSVLGNAAFREREREKEREGINLHAAECRWQHTVIAVVAVYPFKCRRSRGLVTVSLNFAWAMDLV